jgi:serine/threonine-protein kinase
VSLAPGTRLGPYEIGMPLGAGGMGEVYRARDTTLRRDVAIKVLPQAFSEDAERLARFEREAQLLAQLHHPNVASIFGLEHSGAVRALVMELVEGQTLAERLESGPLPLDESLSIARQVAEGLEEAHEKGIVHRDLKPANVKLTPDGKVKVLDFGLAKAYAGDGAGASSDLSQSPTLAHTGTAAGLILGTAAYMSPEQARGKPVDKRADIWAFGVVLFEMLTGRQLFAGETVSDVLAGVLKSEVDLGALPKEAPPALRRLLRRCLERNPRNRLHDIADARIVLDELAGGRSDGGAAAPAPDPPWRRALPWAVGALGIAVGIGTLAMRGSRPGTEPRELPVLRFAIPLPADAPLFVESYPGRSLALSPDGTQIVYATASSAADTRLRLRRLDETEIRSLPGTENGRAPFFSPDGEWLAYFDWAESAIKKVSVRGGRAVTLARGFANAGWMLGTWCDDGRIVFDTWNVGLRVLSGEGGEPRVLTQPTDEWHLDPQPLPGPCRVLFYTHRTEGQAIEAIAADGGGRTRILDNASHGRFLASGHLLFVREGALHVAPFDAERLKVTGAALPVPIEAAPDWFNVSAPNPQLAVSRSGTLVYAPSDEKAGSGSPLVAVTHDGRVEELAALPFLYPTMALAPDGEALALTGRRAGVARIEALDLRRKATTDVAGLGAVDMPAQPVWTPDGKAILYTRYGPFEGEIVRHALDARVPDQVLLRLPGTWLCPWSISPDGRWLVISRYTPDAQADLLLLDLAKAPGAAAVRPLVATADEENGAAISPNGEWFAYSFNKGGGIEILVEKFPEGGQKTRVSSAAGPPVWSPDGRDIYFSSTARGGGELDMMAARVELTPSLRVSEPRRLFSGPFMRGTDMGRAFGITRDGRRFLMVRTPPGVPVSSGTGSARQLLVVQGWFAELRRGQEGKGP